MVTFAERTPTAVDPDRTLVQAARAGDPTAFEALARRHGDTALRVATRIVGPDDAPDVCQEALLRAFHRLPRFQETGSFRAWLLQITHNSAVDALERRRSDATDPSAFDAERDADPQRSPAARLEEHERRDRLQSKLELLRPTHRAVLVLRDVEGLSYDEIAEITQSPLGSVKGRLHRARGELIDLLRANTYDWELPG
ncbi:MAG TPA: sigma-70 family RNA polymerase sigma factor [Solirubrobacteraceae bacterium]|nr:sigma-70 family RNA polymerase sigma factor [Solirubrobacteraceae bacterium]